MLSLFPQFFDWSWYVPFFFRMFLAWYLLAAGYRIAKYRDASEPTEDSAVAWGLMGGIIILPGVAFLVGAWVQIAAIMTFSLALLAIWFRKQGRGFTPEGKKFYLLLGLVALSLLFLGPGPFAFDLPL